MLPDPDEVPVLAHHTLCRQLRSQRFVSPGMEAQGLAAVLVEHAAHVRGLEGAAVDEVEPQAAGDGAAIVRHALTDDPAYRRGLRAAGALAGMDHAAAVGPHPHVDFFRAGIDALGLGTAGVDTGPPDGHALAHVAAVRPLHRVVGVED